MLFKYKISKNINGLDKTNFVKKFVENISNEFIDYLCEDKKNKIYCYSMDNKITHENITSIIIYRKLYYKNRINYIIFLLATHPEFRENGYGNIILLEFINKIKSKNINNKKIFIVLHSLESTFNFYCKFGFYRISKSIFIKNYEGLKTTDDKIILEYEI